MARPRYQLRARNVAGIRIRFPFPLELPPAASRSTSYEQPAVAAGLQKTRNDSTPREIVSTRATTPRANRFLFTVSRKEERLLRSCLSRDSRVSRVSRCYAVFATARESRMAKRTHVTSVLFRKLNIISNY